MPDHDSDRPMNEADRQRLASAALAARENNDSLEFMDHADRLWFVGCDTVDNRSHVLIQVHRGQNAREVRLATDTFSPQRADAAITQLNGELP